MGIKYHRIKYPEDQDFWASSILRLEYPDCQVFLGLIIFSKSSEDQVSGSSIFRIKYPQDQVIYGSNIIVKCPEVQVSSRLDILGIKHPQDQIS
jgi:hypothetical protein